MPLRRVRPLRCIAVTLALALAGCAWWRPVTAPLATIRAPAPCVVRPDTLLVMLPGAYSRPEEFEREGFVRAVRERGLAADIVLVDAHVGYYTEQIVIDRLRADVIAPALAQGYTRIWLIGISIGGFGALLYGQAQPQGISGIVAIAPYLGKPRLIEEIGAQGGLRAWRAPAGPPRADDADKAVWRWLQSDARARPPLLLGYGRDDRLKAGHQLLGAALPADRVFTADGGHDWAPWLAVWNQMLETMPLEHAPGCTARD